MLPQYYYSSLDPTAQCGPSPEERREKTEKERETKSDIETIKIDYDSQPEDAIDVIKKIFKDFGIKFEREELDGTISFKYEKPKVSTK